MASGNPLPKDNYFPKTGASRADRSVPSRKWKRLGFAVELHSDDEAGVSGHSHRSTRESMNPCLSNYDNWVGDFPCQCSSSD